MKVVSKTKHCSPKSLKLWISRVTNDNESDNKLTTYKTSQVIMLDYNRDGMGSKTGTKHFFTHFWSVKEIPNYTVGPQIEMKLRPVSGLPTYLVANTIVTPFTPDLKYFHHFSPVEAFPYNHPQWEDNTKWKFWLETRFDSCPNRVVPWEDRSSSLVPSMKNVMGENLLI